MPNVEKSHDCQTDKCKKWWQMSRATNVIYKCQSDIYIL